MIIVHLHTQQGLGMHSLLVPPVLTAPVCAQSSPHLGRIYMSTQQFGSVVGGHLLMTYHPSLPVYCNNTGPAAVL